eukprot:GHVN01085949.1.p2 GENE.GHVN01085949.1~~GHVN01085949.1.p2  ORF type:complete len:139 (+),score=6.52 GHVN01085949.1:554-970(+)
MARFVVLGNNVRDTYGKVELDNPWTLPSSLNAVRMLIAVAATNNWRVDQCDVTSAYLQAPINEDEIYAKLPDEAYVLGINKKGIKDLVHKIKKALYGLKRSGGDWRIHLEHELINNGFERCTDTERSLFTKDECILTI